MPEYKTSFAFLMDSLNVGAAEICEKTGADKTLVSRWRNGKRRLMPGRQWVKAVADCFIAADAQYKASILTEMLGSYYPSQALDTEEKLHAVLCKWLSGGDVKQAQYQTSRRDMNDRLWDGVVKAQEELAAGDARTGAQQGEASPKAPVENIVAYGVQGVQNATMMFLELLLAKSEPLDVIYVCPQGLDMYTRDERFNGLLIDKLMEVFEAGHRFSVVLRTDYKMSDVSAFSGRWLAAHLLGYVRSRYYDDFRNIESEKMLLVAENQFAMKAVNTSEGLTTAIYFDQPTVSGIYAESLSYNKKSVQRFRYGVFEKPNGFLKDVSDYKNQPAYLFAKVPLLGQGAAEQLTKNFTMTKKEAKTILSEFPFFFSDPEDFAPEAAVRHIYCEDDIEDALLKSRSAMTEMSAILGRDIFMNTRILVDSIVSLKRQLSEHKNYEVCFLPAEHFNKIGMQIGVWGDKAAIGWMGGARSAACRDYTNVGALHGFCNVVFDMIPHVMKSRGAANKKLAMWIKKAKKYGYDV